MSEKRDVLLNYIVAFLAVAAYGSFGLFVRWTGLAGDEEYLVFWRILIALPIVIVVVLLARDPDLFKAKGCWTLLVFNGLAFAGQTYSASKAINLLPIKDAAFIIYLAPVLVAFAAPFFLKEKLEKTTMIALGVGIGGLALISLAGQGDAGKSLNAAGICWALFGAVCYAATILSLKWLRERLHTLTIMLYPTIVLLLVFLPFVRFRVPTMTGSGWASLVVLGVVHGFLLGLVYVHVVKKVKAQHIGIISYVDPVTATFLAFIFLGEAPVWQDYVGGALIILAGLIVIFTAEREVAEEPWA